MVTEGRFGKAQKLKSRKAIDQLFAKGNSVNAFPIRVKYQLLPATEAVTVQAGFTASKKHFKHAVDRNRLKRQMREAYRLQKNALLQTAKESKQSVALFFMYSDKVHTKYDIIYNAAAKCLEALQQKIKVTNEKAG